jgi:hypothetical protein
LNFDIQPTKKSEQEINIKSESIVVKTETEKSLNNNCDKEKFVRKSPKLEKSDGKDPINLHLNFKCKYCNRCFFKPKWLENHLRKHHNKKVLVVSDKKLFRERKKPPIKVEPPMDSVEPAKPLKVLPKIPKLNCKLCRKRFSKIKAYKIHVQNKLCYIKPKTKVTSALNGTTATSKHCCSKCSKSFVNVSGLNYHLNNNVCGDGATDKSEASERPMKKHACKICMRSFNQLKGLEYHRVNKVCIKERDKVGYRCKSCKKQFLNLSGFQYHNQHQVRKIFLLNSRNLPFQMSKFSFSNGQNLQ